MNAMTDNSFDDLIRETLARRDLLTDLNSLIVADVRRQARRAWLRRWVRVALFSFGLPLVLIVFFACTYLYIKVPGRGPMSYFVMLWPTIGLLFSTGYALRTFSPDEV